MNVPDGKSGNWEVSTFEVSEADVFLNNIRASFKPRQRRIEVGVYKRLTYRGQVVMSNTPAETSDCKIFVRIVHNSGGHILINGLGLGVVLASILEIDKVESVTVIEKSSDVIALVKPTFEGDSRVNIIEADAFDWKPPRGIRYSAVWNDIWNNVCSDNLAEMTRLHRKYGRIADWQGSWCREECKRYRTR